MHTPPLLPCFFPPFSIQFLNIKMIKQVQEIVDGVQKVESEVPGMKETFTVYFIKDRSNVLIDPGPSCLVPVILAAAKELGITDFQYIIPTHIHMDHAGGSGRLAGIFKRATIVANSQGARHIIDPSRLIRSTKMAFGNDFENTFGSIIPVVESRVKVVRDGEKLRIGDTRDLIFYEAPGHAPHHLAIFDTKTAGLFCGEALGLIYDADTPPLSAATAPSYDPEEYIRTMERLREIPSKVLFYSHGGMSREPEKSITIAIENVKAIGEVILRNLKTNQEDLAIHKIDSYIRERFGVNLSEYSLMNNINGYKDYFKKKGLL